MVSVYPLLLFGGGQIGVDLSRGNFILSVDDGWIKFMAQSHQVSGFYFFGAFFGLNKFKEFAAL